jgi:alpha-glucosidase (family GH31 glycosyl hydrolase)
MNANGMESRNDEKKNKKSQLIISSGSKQREKQRVVYPRGLPDVTENEDVTNENVIFEIRRKGSTVSVVVVGGVEVEVRTDSVIIPDRP